MGLFVALYEMAQLAAGSDEVTDATFGEWLIEYEGAEDFDICVKPPCSDANYLHSRHQVKARAGKDGRYFSDYTRVVAPYINSHGTNMPGFNKDVKDEDGNIIANVEVPASRRFIHLVQSVSSWKGDLTSNPNQVSPYTYPAFTAVPAQNFCKLSNSANNISAEQDEDFPLDEAAYEQINKIVSKNRSEIKLIWLALQVALQKKIAACHDNDTKPRPKFTFQNIFTDFLINNTSLSGYINDFEADIFRRSLINAWGDIQQRYDAGEGIGIEARTRIETWLSEVQKKSNSDLKAYINSFSPDVYPPPKDIQRDGFQEVVCQVIRQVKTVPSVNTHHYKKDGLPYFLTTINLGVGSYPIPTLAASILRGIDNSSDNRYKQPCLIVTHEHEFDLDDPAFADRLEYDEDSEELASTTIAGVEVLNIEAYQPRKVITVEKAVRDLNQGDES